MLTVKLVQARLLRWKATNTKQTRKVFQQLRSSKEKVKESFHDQLGYFLIMLSRNQVWARNVTAFIVVTYRFTRREFMIY